MNERIASLEKEIEELKTLHVNELEDSYNNGHSDGFEKGSEEGYSNGYNDGRRDSI